MTWELVEVQDKKVIGIHRFLRLNDIETIRWNNIVQDKCFKNMLKKNVLISMIYYLQWQDLQLLEYF